MRKGNQKRHEKHEEIRIGRRIKRLRNYAGLRQDELGHMVDVSAAQISAWENNEIEPGFYAVCLIADALGVSLDQIAGREPVDTGALSIRF